MTYISLFSLDFYTLRTNPFVVLLSISDRHVHRVPRVHHLTDRGQAGLHPRGLRGSQRPFQRGGRPRPVGHLPGLSKCHALRSTHCCSGGGGLFVVECYRRTLLESIVYASWMNVLRVVTAVLRHLQQYFGG